MSDSKSTKEFKKANKVADSAISSKKGFILASEYLEKAIDRMAKRGHDFNAAILAKKKQIIDMEIEKRGLESPQVG